MKRIISQLRQILFLVFIISGLTFYSACWSSETGKRSSKNKDKWETYSASPKPDKDTETNSDESDNSNGDMTESTEKNIKSGGFTSNLPDGFSAPNDPVGKKMFKEYGAMFVARNGAIPPGKIVFDNEAEVSAWQSSVSKQAETVGGKTIELQTPAMSALKEAIIEAQQNGLTISPRGDDAARRNYSGTVALWESRVNPGLDALGRSGQIRKSGSRQNKIFAGCFTNYRNFPARRSRALFCKIAR